MDEKSLERVHEDLAIMRRTLGLELPFEWEHVWACLALCAVGAVVAAITVGTNISVPPVVRGSAAQWGYIGLVILPVFLVMAVMAMVARRRREVAPLFWSECRGSWATAALAVPLYVGFVAWVSWSGLSASTLTASTLFLVGFAALLTGIADRSRRYTLGYAFATLAAVQLLRLRVTRPLDC